MDEDADATEPQDTLTPAQETALTEAKVKEKAKVRDQQTKEKEKATLPRPTPMAHANPNLTPALTAVAPAITHAIASNA